MLSDIILKENVVPLTMRKPQLDVPTELGTKKTFGLRDTNVLPLPSSQLNPSISKPAATEFTQQMDPSLDESIEEYHPPSATDDYSDIFRYTGRLDELLNGVTELIAQQAKLSPNPTNSSQCDDYATDEETSDEELYLPDELLASLYPRLF